VAAYDRGYARRRPGQYGDEEINQTQPVGAPVPMAEPIAPPAALVDPPPPVTPPAAAPPAIPPPLTGGIGNHDLYTGFDLQREQNRKKSAKDSFAHHSGQNAGSKQWFSKDGAEDWFTQFVLPGLEADGFEVDDVRGDLAFIHTGENPEGTWIDYVRDADGSNQALQWLDQSYMDDGAGGAGAGDAGAALQQMPGGADIFGALTSEDGSMMEEIQAELERLLRGEDPGSPNAPVAI
jgi:hypothetical protein